MIDLAMLSLLKERINKYPERYNFASAAGEEEIKRIEFLLGIALPRSYREFLLNFDGGYICSNFLAARMKFAQDEETARWNSLQIFGIQELYDIYAELSDLNWKMPLEWEGVYPIVPFARTSTQEFLVFAQPLDSNSESPVFDAFHEEPVDDWGILHADFNAFLSAYIEHDGSLNTIATSGVKTMADFLPDNNWQARPDEIENPDFVLKYNFELIKMHSKTDEAFLNIAEAFCAKQEFPSAEFYLGKALQIDPQDDYAYYIESKILNAQKKYREAVMAISKAISLQDDNSFYYMLRSNYHLELDLVKDALQDCNLGLACDPDYGYGFYCRSLVWEKLNRHEQAFADMKKAVELEPENALYASILAEYYLKKEEYHRVLEICLAALKYNPADFSLHYLCERAYRLLGNLDKADAEANLINNLLGEDF